MHPNDIIKEVCIFYGQISGGLLYISKAKDGKLYIKLYDDHIVNTELLRKAAAGQVKLPKEVILPLTIYQEITVDDIKRILSQESLNQNYFAGPKLKSFFDIEKGDMWLKDKYTTRNRNFMRLIEHDKAKPSIHTTIDNPYIKERIDDWYDFELCSGVNWALDPFESDNDDEDGEHFNSGKILNHIFKTLELS